MQDIISAKNIINQIPEKDRDKVESIELEVGEFSEIKAQELKKAIEDLVGWNVIINKINPKTKCECGYIGKINLKQKDKHLLVHHCPSCGSRHKYIIGEDIKVKNIVYF